MQRLVRNLATVIATVARPYRLPQPTIQWSVPRRTLTGTTPVRAAGVVPPACRGCGAPLQLTHADAPGFMPAATIERCEG